MQFLFNSSKLYCIVKKLHINTTTHIRIDFEQEDYGWTALAMPYAAADAMAPIRTVCKALLKGLLPVK